MCIFCNIIDGKIPANILYQDSKIMVFHDINPKATIHLVCIPKMHIENLGSLETQEQKSIVGYLVEKSSEIASLVGLSDFRLITNSGKNAGQEVFHLHFHLLGGEKIPSF